MEVKRHIRDILYALKQKSILILAYHSIADGTDFYGVTTDMFRKQMGWLSRQNYAVINLDEAVGRFYSKQIDKKYVVITFDDGYKNNFTNAYQVLKAYNFKATFFIVTNAIGLKNVWDDSVLQLMNWDELNQLYDDGNIIGSHTHSHINLSGITDEELLSLELEYSCQVIQDKIKTTFIPFAFPYGAGVYNERVRQKVIKNYPCAVKSCGFFGNNSDADLWSLKRTRIDSTIGMKEFEYIAKGFHDIKFITFAFKELKEILREKWNERDS